MQKPRDDQGRYRSVHVGTWLGSFSCLVFFRLYRTYLGTESLVYYLTHLKGRVGLRCWSFSFLFFFCSETCAGWYSMVQVWYGCFHSAYYCMYWQTGYMHLRITWR